jgi:hypothetical protein
MRITDIKPENLIGEKTLKYQLEDNKGVFYSIIFVNKDKMPNETMRIFNGDLIKMLDKLALMIKKEVDIKNGMHLDFDIDVFEVVDIYVNFKNNKVNIEYSLL